MKRFFVKLCESEKNICFFPTNLKPLSRKNRYFDRYLHDFANRELNKVILQKSVGIRLVAAIKILY